MPETGYDKNASKRPPIWLGCGNLGICLAVISVIFFLKLSPAKQAILHPLLLIKMNPRSIQLDAQSSRFILRSAIPALERVVNEEDPLRLLQPNWTELYWKLATGLQTTEPREILCTQLPALAIAKPLLLPKTTRQTRALSLQAEIEPEQEANMQAKNSSRDFALAGEPEVLIYHTHTSESYIPVSGKDHTLNQRGDIVKAGERLTEILERKYKIRTIHCRTIHDQVPFRESYHRSLVTIKQYLQRFPSLKIIIDLHRDATPGVHAVCRIHGKKTATMVIVVGSDKMGLPHPFWKKNCAFAREIAELARLLHPGLCNGVIVSDARYNQHLHPHSLIFEIGDQNSTWEEVNRSIELFSEVLAVKLNQSSQ